MSCQDNTVEGTTDNYCASAFTACASTPQAPGPLTQVFRRQVQPDGATGPWASQGFTCFPGTDPGQPGAPARPLLTYAMIRDAWAHTPFAKPGQAIQPPGGLTLVHLPTYLQATWPAAGFQPGEIHTVTLLGRQVRIRPALISFTYHFGDGATAGPTASPGGPYPDGDIQHTYTRPGRYTTRVDATYGGHFSVDGGAWIPITETLAIAGPALTLQVATAVNRLIS